MSVWKTLFVWCSVLMAGSMADTGADDETTPRTCSRSKAAFAKSSAETSAHIVDPHLDLTDVLNYRIELDVDTGARRVQGVGTMTVKSLSDDLATFRFWLHGNYVVTSLEVAGAGVSWRRLDSTVVEADLDRGYDPGEIFEIRVGYQGFPPLFGGLIFDTIEEAALVFTLTEPWYSYTWFPVKEDSRDKATGDVLITVPAAMTVVSNGLLVEIANAGGGRRRHHWSTDYPTSPYLFAFSATEYEMFSDRYTHTGGSMPVEFYLYPESNTPINRYLWSRSVAMLGSFGAMFGPYPFLDEKYAIIARGRGFSTCYGGWSPTTCSLRSLPSIAPDSSTGRQPQRTS